MLNYIYIHVKFIYFIQYLRMNTQTTEQQSTHLSRTDKSQLAYQKLDKAFGGVGENISTR